VAEVVNATDEQVKQLEAIAREHQEAAHAAQAQRRELMEAKREEIDALRREMREARRAGDNERVRELQGQIREIIGKRPHGLMRQTHEKIKAILTEEQRPAFEAMVAELRSGDRHPRRGGERPGRRGGEVNIYDFIKRVADAVDPTDEQRQQLQKIAADHIRALKAAEADRDIARQEHREELESLHRQLREARKARDAEQIKALGETMRGLLGAPMRDVVKSTHDKIKAILTDEQKPKFEAVVKEARTQAGKRLRERGDRFRGRRARAKRPDRLPPPPLPPAPPEPPPPPPVEP
jgi:hypothetical protein